jgi:alpha-beta hydrolase superfamily lysophospholipase
MSTPSETTGTLLAKDGTRLFYREWLVNHSRAILVIVHGLGEHGARYLHVAARLNALGISVRVHDQRGHGRSDGKRAALASATDPLDDLKLVVDDFAHQQASTPFLLGHSLGGLIAARFATANLSPLRGLILSSPALAFELSLRDRILLAVSSRLAPSAAVANKLDVDKLSHDLTVVAAYRGDALVHGVVTARLVRFMQTAVAETMRDAATLKIPVLMLVAGHDALVDASGSRAFYDRLPTELRTLRWYDQAYHEIFNESTEQRAIVLNDLSVWLDAEIHR